MNEKYYDLCLVVSKDVDPQVERIYCHKSKVCEKSPLIKMLVRREQEKIGEWPPVHTINLIAPSNISPETFQMAINYVYDTRIPDKLGKLTSCLDETKSHPAYGSLIPALDYLSIEYDSSQFLPWELTRKSRRAILDKEDHISTLRKVAKHTKNSRSYHYFLAYYYPELKLELQCDNRAINFGVDFTEEEILRLYKEEFPDESVSAKEKYQVYIPSLFPNGDSKQRGKTNIIEACGVKWSFSTQQSPDTCDIYGTVEVHHVPEEARGKIISFRLLFITYSFDQEVDIQFKKCLDIKTDDLARDRPEFSHYRTKGTYFTLVCDKVLPQERVRHSFVFIPIALP